MPSTDHPQILIVDDDLGFFEAAQVLAAAKDIDTRGAHSLRDARQALRANQYDLVVLDLGLPDGSGFDLVQEFGTTHPIAVATGSTSLDTAARAVGMPISHYLVKPVVPSAFDRLLDHVQTEWTANHRASERARKSFGAFVGESSAMQYVYKQIRRVAATSSSVLLVGESGTGKELAAKALHDASARKGAFVAVNCGAVSPELLGSHLFGHERGSFTGAARQHRGHFEQADGGTLLLDEITEMPLNLQAHLLRVLESHAITRLGGTSDVRVDVRVIGATNREPFQAIREGRLREDLYFRLAEFTIQLPPLRQRGDDVCLIAESILRSLNETHATRKRFAKDVHSRLCAHAWRGNVRELRNAVNHAYVMSDGDDVDFSTSLVSDMPHPHSERMLMFPVGTSFDIVEREMLFRTLAHFDGDKARTAKALGISLKTVYNHLSRTPEPQDEARSR